jgi:tetratricopeptide (TPR) repeat protein
MKCPRCGADNQDADRFCAKCGALLASEQASSYDPKQAAELVETALQLSDEGKLDDAIRTAEQAVACNPRSTSAHSILGILLYRRGETERAIAEYRIVLSLSPASSADRTRLEEILGVGRKPAGRRWWIALAGALLVLVALLVTVVVFVSRPGARQRPTATVARAPGPGANETGPMIAPPLPPAPSLGPSAPAPAGPSAAAAAPPGGGPTVVRAQPPTTMSAAPTLPPVQPGITLPTIPGTEGGPSSAQPVSAAEREARQYFLRGDYESAIASYQRTLQELPGAPARVHQDLALAYMRAGRAAEALAEFRTAADSYRDQISQGRDVPGAQLGLGVCEEAIQLLERMP